MSRWDAAPICGERSPEGYVCHLDINHHGDHKAVAAEEEVITAWSGRVDVSDMGIHPVDDILIRNGVSRSGLAELTDELHAAGYQINPTLRSLRGRRVEDGGRMGTLVVCPQCDGDRVLHELDELPESVEPQDDGAVVASLEEGDSALGFDIAVEQVVRTKSNMGHQQITEILCSLSDALEWDPEPQLLTALLKFSNADLGDVRPGDRLAVTVHTYRIER